jgi:hypothetical protein
MITGNEPSLSREPLPNDVCLGGGSEQEKEIWKLARKLCQIVNINLNESKTLLDYYKHAKKLIDEQVTADTLIKARDFQVELVFSVYNNKHLFIITYKAFNRKRD